MAFSRITIIGLGLIGGSLARDLKKQEDAPYIVGCNRNKDSLEKACELGLIDEGITDLAEAVKDADLVVIGTPLSSYEAILKAIQPHVDKKTIITDVGSVKAPVVTVAQGVLTKEQMTLFVPAHPIAGSEKSGVEASVEGLYQDKRLIITPHDTLKKTALNAVKTLWKQCGANVEVMEAGRHDSIYAQNSHLVQVLAFGFKAVVKIFPKDDPNVAVFTRLCDSSPDMWMDIFAFNEAALRDAKDLFLTHFSALHDLIEHQDTEALMVKVMSARVLRHRIEPLQQKAVSTCPTVFMLLPHLLACALMHTVEERNYAGSGLKSFTENLLSWDMLKADDFMKHAKTLLPAMKAFERLFQIKD